MLFRPHRRRSVVPCVRSQVTARGTLSVERLDRRLCPAPVLALAVAEPVVLEGESFQVTLTLSESSAQAQRVLVSTTPITANYGVDYFAPLSQQVTFAPGERSKRITIPTLRDAPVDVTEGVEFLTITAAPAEPSLGTRSARVGIADYVAPPGISVADARKTEGDSGTSTMAFVVSLTAAYPKPVTVSFATRDGSATTADSDYAAASGTITFAPGETAKQISVTINGDQKLEPDETFALTISSPSYGRISRGVAMGTIVNDEVDTPGFQITVTFDSTVTAAQRPAFLRAAARWSQIIVSDLPSVSDAGTFVDDVTIAASCPAIDGPGGILGQAAPSNFRPNAGGLPWKGFMEFDSADVAAMLANGTFTDVILHEMGHVLGVGTLWSRLNLLQGAGTTDPEYVGVNGLREYRNIFSLPAATGVPVENSGGGGTRDSHWRESVFRTELMTGYAEPPGTRMPISRITVGQFQDLGYAVNYNAADAYTKPLVNPPPVRPSPVMAIHGVALQGAAQRGDDRSRLEAATAAAGMDATVTSPAQPTWTPPRRLPRRTS